LAWPIPLTPDGSNLHRRPHPARRAQGLDIGLKISGQYDSFVVMLEFI